MFFTALITSDPPYIDFHEVLVTVYVIANTVCVSGSQLCQSVMPVGVEKISTAQKYVLARRRLVKLINNRAKLLSLCSCILNEVTWKLEW